MATARVAPVFRERRKGSVQERYLLGRLLAGDRDRQMMRPTAHLHSHFGDAVCKRRDECVFHLNHPRGNRAKARNPGKILHPSVGIKTGHNHLDLLQRRSNLNVSRRNLDPLGAPCLNHFHFGLELPRLSLFSETNGGTEPNGEKRK